MITPTFLQLSRQQGMQAQQQAWRQHRARTMVQAARLRDLEVEVVTWEPQELHIATWGLGPKLGASMYRISRTIWTWKRRSLIGQKDSILRASDWLRLTWGPAAGAWDWGWA